VKLTTKYTKETNVLKKKEQLFIKKKFTNLFFLETIQYKSKKASKRKKEVNKRKKDKQISAESDKKK
jgi:hypothetical protein